MKKYWPLGMLLLIGSMTVLLSITYSSSKNFANSACRIMKSGTLLEDSSGKHVGLLSSPENLSVGVRVTGSTNTIHNLKGLEIQIESAEGSLVYSRRVGYELRFTSAGNRMEAIVIPQPLNIHWTNKNDGSAYPNGRTNEVLYRKKVRKKLYLSPLSKASLYQEAGN